MDEWISEIGDRMNLKRKKFLYLMDSIKKGEVVAVVIAHKDRLARFGYEYLEHMAVKNDCEIIVANQESFSPQEEMVQDLLAIAQIFSCRLYGLRRYEKTLREQLTGGVK